MLKQYTLVDGTSATVNLLAIAYMRPDPDGTLIIFIGGASVVVSEPYDEVSGTNEQGKVVGFGAVR